MLVCFGRAIAAKNGDFFQGRNSSGLGWDHMRVRREEEEFQPPIFSHRLLDPIEDTERRWENNVKCWVCFDSVEIRAENFLFIPVCAPLAGQERTHPETTRGCLGLVVVKAYVSEQHGVSGITNTYKWVGFGGLKDKSWFDQRDEGYFLLL
jgi:hypothetical protein